MQKAGPPPWLEIALELAGDAMRVSARGSRGEQTPHHELAAADVARFAEGVQRAAAGGRSLGADLLAQAQAIHGAVLRAEIGELRAQLGEAAAGPLLVRLLCQGPALQQVPWEALAQPRTGMGFWGTSPDLLPVRGVVATAPWVPREVRGAVRVLAVAPLGGPSLAVLKEALADRIAAGEVEWLEPLAGDAAQKRHLLHRLTRAPFPHALHFVGHGGLHAGAPSLRLADDDGDEAWLQVELLAQQLKAFSGGFLRLAVLEACDGAKPGAFASAAEMMAQHGVDAVVAHLWPVRADVARACSARFYDALASVSSPRGGDVAFALNEARRAVLTLFDASAEAFSPVVYLRGPDGALFDFTGRKVEPRLPSAPPPPSVRAIDPGLARIVRERFSLVLGDRWKSEREGLDRFREKLHKELAGAPEQAPAGLSMSALAQRFALRRGADKLGAEFQRAFRGATEVPAVFRALARRLGPGVHTTLLRIPLLELALAEEQPEATLHVIQPDEESTLVLCREPGGDWEALDAPPSSIDLDRELVVLRLYRGYTPERIFTRPLLTEDDYLLGFRELESVLPRDVADEMLGVLRMRPALIAGMSLTTWHHRMLLHRLFGRRPVPQGSVAVVEPDDGERDLWEKGTSLPGRAGVEVAEVGGDALAAMLSAIEGAGRR